MANYKVVDADELEAILTAIANVVRSKTGKTDLISHTDLATEIEGIGSIKQLIAKTITDYSDDSLTSLGDYTFYRCSELSSIDLPNVTSIGNYAFNGCLSLSSIDLPNVTSVGNYAFNGCTNLSSIDLPNVASVGNYAFNRCLSLSSIDLPNVTSFEYPAFPNCSNLSTIVLRTSDEICSLSSDDTFVSTPFASGGTGGRVFVPSALIESYQTATNWSTLYAAGTCTFLPLEEYTFDGTISGDIDWDTINALDEEVTIE